MLCLTSSQRGHCMYLKNVNFVEVEGATAKAVQYLFVGEEAERAVSCYSQQVVGNERVNLSQSTRHAVQLGRRDEVVEVARRHATQEVALTKLYHRRHLRPHNSGSCAHKTLSQASPATRQIRKLHSQNSITGVTCDHTTQEVALTKLYHRRHL